MDPKIMKFIREARDEHDMSTNLEVRAYIRGKAMGVLIFCAAPTSHRKNLERWIACKFDGVMPTG